ncbi:MAG TPA: aminoglycoside phosphotransferase family protein, partial [Herpetosiphonaceae bacterium]|nr:aminoglycoside phosphotransferase family protein [Herpetosiphonaceae bacterium]
MPESFDTATLDALVRHHIPDASGLCFTRIGTGKHNTSYWVDSHRERLVLRLAPPDETGLLFYERQMMRQEPELHALIRARTSIPVADVVAYDFSRTQIDRDYLLLIRLPGTPLSDVALPSRSQRSQFLRQAGGYLRQLHGLIAPECLGVDAYGYLGAHHPMKPQPTWLAAFEVMWNKLLDDVVACGCYSVVEAQALRDLFDRHRGYFDRSVSSSLLHMDIWSQNILVDAEGNASGLVDFDRALWGDVEIEFAVLDYCGISTSAFWQGYGMQ